MKKPEREALREYVGAVCQYAESRMSIEVEGIDFATVSFAGQQAMSLHEYRTEASDRLNAADDRLRALGMLA